MKRLPLMLATLIVPSLIILSGCEQMANPFSTSNAYSHPGPQGQQQARRQVPQQNVTAGAVPPAAYTAASDCSARAADRAKMFDRPDTYPISEQQRKDAYNSLYSSCMREHDWQVAGASHNNVAPSYAASLASLAPAAGGPPRPAGTTVNAGGTLVTTSPAPGGGTVVVVGGSGTGNTQQLSSLSPAAGGSGYPQGATVVMVQSPQAVPVQPVVMPTIPTGPLPVAVPIPPPPMARGYTPVNAPTSLPQAASPAIASHAPVPQAAYAPPPATGAGTPSGVIPVPSTGANAQIENVLEQ